ncbi:MAG: transcription termination/antitermination protein NusA [Acidobacteriota bacterium]|nr:MAG: transcription termination/antitermination protein NusA [Acidobacteriota bacterium]
MNVLDAIQEIGRAKEIDPESVIQATEEAFVAAARKFYRSTESFIARVNRENNTIEVFLQKTAVEEVQDPDLEISVEEARRTKPDAQPGETILIPRSTREFGRIAVQTAKQVIYQRVREAERTSVYERYAGKIGDLLSGVARRLDRGNAIVTVGRTEAILPRRFQVRGKTYAPGDRVRAVIVEVETQARGPQIVLSRIDPRLVQRLLEIEVPEIQEGIVRIRGLARDPGDRTKVAVESTVPKVDPVGACVGMKGYRVQNIIHELGGEKVDVILYSSDLATYVRNALAPAKISKMSLLSRTEKRVEVVVADDQLSLAIGRGGQNVRLAAQLIGWHIEIKSAETKRKEVSEQMTTATEVQEDNLRELDGVGKTLEKELKKAGFETIASIAAASPEQLTAVPGVGKKTAERLRQSVSEKLAALATPDSPEAEQTESAPQPEAPKEEAPQKAAASDTPAEN